MNPVKLSRRSLLSSAGAFLGTMAAGIEWSSAADLVSDPFPPLPSFLKPTVSAEDKEIVTTSLGTAEPGQDRKDIAKKVLDGAPFRTTPYQVALYFRNVGQGQFGADLAPYVRGWPYYYNPVIIEFFRGTGLNPLDRDQDGDGTSWCAAFVNWCIARAASPAGVLGTKELQLGSQSASSGSFRCWPAATGVTNSPKKGDIAVWAVDGTVNECHLGAGHVAFFEAFEGDDIVVIGGNQRDPSVNQQAVVRKRVPRVFNRKIADHTVPCRFHSFRTAPFLS